MEAALRRACSELNERVSERTAEPPKAAFALGDEIGEREHVERQIPAALEEGPAVIGLGLVHALDSLIEGRVLPPSVGSGFREDGFECENCGHLKIVELPSCPLYGGS